MTPATQPGRPRDAATSALICAGWGGSTASARTPPARPTANRALAPASATTQPFRYAATTASVLVAAVDSGRPMSLADAQIAGICLSSGHELATRKVRDFAGVDSLIVLNPFE